MTEEPVKVTLPDADGAVTIELEKKSEGEAGEKQPIVSPEEGIQSLKDQVVKAQADSARRLAEKDRVIKEAFDRANAAEAEVVTTRKDTIGTVIESLTKDKETAKRDYQTAMETGDFAKAADAQDRLSVANARIVEAERGKVALEEEIKAPKPQPRTVETQRYDDPVEQLAAQLHPRSASWVRSHPDYVTDPTLNDAMIEAHNTAVKRHIPLDTDEYFGFINKRLGIEEGNKVQEPSRERSTAPISAPVGRDVAQTPRRSTPGTITLTPAQAQTARDLGMSYQDYAKQLVECEKEGKIQRSA